VPLVEAGDESGPENCDGRPARRPRHVAHRRQAGAPGAKKQDTQDAIANYMAGLADEEVPNLEPLPVHAEEKMQHGIKDAAGIAGGKQRRRFNGDEDEPENGGDPGLQDVVAIGVQAGNLLDAIVGGLAGNHYIVDVALAESSAADADEARFLQKIGNSGATAIAHT